MNRTTDELRELAGRERPWDLGLLDDYCAELQQALLKALTERIELETVCAIIDEVEAMYPEWLFPADRVPDGTAARMARLTCQNIKRLIVERTSESGEPE